MVTWNDTWIIGNARIDAGHRRFFDLVEALETALVSGEDRSTVKAIVVAIIADTAAHFSEEEEILTDFDYPGIARHRELHRTVMATVEAALARCDEDDDREAWLDACREVKSTLVRHLTRDDMEFKRFLMEKGVAGESES